MPRTTKAKTSTRTRTSTRTSTRPKPSATEQHSPKQQRQAEHIAEGYAKRGVPAKRRKAIAWATVNKRSGGATRRGRSAGGRRGAAS